MTYRWTEADFKRLQAGKLNPFSAAVSTAKGTRWEDELAAQLDFAGIPYVREYRFDRDRRFRFDFAFPAQQVALEIDGMVHRIKKRFLSDREKANLAVLDGWRVLHVGKEHVRDGRALQVLQQLLASEKIA